jgi:hypothetical protein
MRDCLRHDLESFRYTFEAKELEEFRPRCTSTKFTYLKSDDYAVETQDRRPPCALAIAITRNTANAPDRASEKVLFD